MRPHRTIILAILGLALVPSIGAKVARARDAARMASAASAFLSELTDDQRAQATFPLDTEERERFHFIPVEMFERGGLMIADMTAPQRERAHDLLRAGLSQRGYMTAVQVMELEGVLQTMQEGGRFARDSDEYFFSIFGSPSGDGSWGWRFEGHHISLHFTLVEGQAFVASPAFVGVSPAEVADGPQQGRRVLGDREDTGRAMIQSLDERQRQVAVIDVEAPRDIVTGNAATVAPLEAAGIEASAMRAGQRAQLMALIDVYLSMMSGDIAEERMARLTEAGTDGIRFAWAGGVDPGEGHYYRVQGPTFLIEYDNTQNGANHIHSVWRDFEGDFGRDLLREHRAEHPHD